MTAASRSTDMFASAVAEAEAAALLGVPPGALSGTLRAVAPRPTRIAPVAFHPDRATMEMLDLGGLQLGLPFFDDAVAALGSGGAGPLRFEANCDTVLSAADRIGCAPAGFLFHSGRCGSTWLANLIAAGGSIVVLKEPGIADMLLALHRRHGHPELIRLTRAAMRLLAAACAQADGGGARPVVFKLSAWSIACADVLLEAFPEAKAVFIYRSPEATIASWIESRPAWLDAALARPENHNLFFPYARLPATASPLRVMASSWRSMACSALAAPRSRLHILSYARLLEMPLESAAQTARHLAGSAPRRAAMRQVVDSYSKAPTGAVRFDPSGSHRRPPLPAAASREVESIARELFDRLEAVRR